MIKLLVELDIIPKVISGSSAGSIASAFFACSTTEETKKNINNPLAIKWDAFYKKD